MAACKIDYFLAPALRTPPSSPLPLHHTTFFVKQATASYIRKIIPSQRAIQITISVNQSKLLVHRLSKIDMGSTLAPEPNGAGMKKQEQVDGNKTSDDLRDYKFPKKKLKVAKDPAKQPIVLIACGSFSPVCINLYCARTFLTGSRLHFCICGCSRSLSTMCDSP